MINLDLTNEQIVYVFTHIKNYKELLTEGLQREMEFMSDQVKAYHKAYSSQKDFNKEIFELYDKLLNKIMPEALNDKVSILNVILDKLNPYYEMIIEAEPSIPIDVDNKYFKESQEALDIVEQIKRKVNDNENEF